MLPSAFQRAHITTWHITIQKTAVSGEKKTPPMAKYVLLIQAHTENKGIKHNWT